MKKILFTTTVLLALLCIVQQTHAVTKTTTSPSPSITVAPSSATASSSAQNSDLMNKIDQQINNLKERIASRVAQLNLVEKRGIVGTVTQASGTEIKLTDIHNNIRFVDVDELTKFSSPSAKGTFGISDLTPGTVVGVLGNYNKESKRILARFVDVMSFPQIVIGTINTIDKANYQFTISVNGKSQLIDVEAFTKTNTYGAADGLTKAGFSKITQGQRAYIVGFPDKKNPSMLVASRIILLTDGSSTTPSDTTSPSSSPTPTKKKG